MPIRLDGPARPASRSLSYEAAALPVCGQGGPDTGGRRPHLRLHGEAGRAPCACAERASRYRHETLSAEATWPMAGMPRSDFPRADPGADDLHRVQAHREEYRVRIDP